MTGRPEHRLLAACLSLAGLLLTSAGLANDSVMEVPIADAGSGQPLQDCLLKAFNAANDDATVGAIKAQCAESEAPEQVNSFRVGPADGRTAVDERIIKEDAVMDRDFILTAHQPNYLLATYNSNVNQAPYQDPLGSDEPLNNGEVKFQISIKAPIFRNPFGWKSNLFFGYTSTSWWQLANSNVSNPFRETNYEPEVFLRSTEQFNALGLKFSGWDLGFNHESNGSSGDLSRSWNRAMASTVIDLNDVAVRLRAWYRLPEDADSDDNPQMYRYMGYGDLLGVWAPSRNTYTLMYRPGTQGGAVEVTWSRPISKIWRIYAQYWNGYGESLIDYNYRTERIGIGFALSDYLER